ncbi:MAG TPA: ferritin-like domain-containing protein [Solirubrobacterales bacterium]|nr:ferritin-like domain-containing protein [Solirubrobacterales bacterium]
MALNRITRGGSVRRALLLAVVVAGLTGGLFACGGGDGDSAVDKDADVGVLNEILARQLAAVEAYGEVLPALRGAELATAREFRSQEQEHVDATTKTLRGLDGESDPPAETIDLPELETPEDAWRFLYTLESATIDAELNAVGRLTIGWPRPLIAAMAANQAQRLVVIRRLLGARPSELIPEAFETGETDAPEEMMGE